MGCVDVYSEGICLLTGGVSRRRALDLRSVMFYRRRLFLDGPQVDQQLEAAQKKLVDAGIQFFAQKVVCRTGAPPVGITLSCFRARP